MLLDCQRLSKSSNIWVTRISKLEYHNNLLPPVKYRAAALLLKCDQSILNFYRSPSYRLHKMFLYINKLVIKTWSSCLKTGIVAHEEQQNKTGPYMDKQRTKVGKKATVSRQLYHAFFLFAKSHASSSLRCIKGRVTCVELLLSVHVLQNHKNHGIKYETC